MRCCSLDISNLGAPEAIRHLIPVEEQAAQALRDGDETIAQTLAIDVLELSPGRVQTLIVLYAIRKRQSIPSAMEALIRRVVTLDRNNFWAVNEITLLLLGKGSVIEAEHHARNAIRIAPDNAQSHYLMGMVLTEAHRPAVAEFHYSRVIALSGTRDPVVLANYALCLKNQGKMQEARELYQEALAGAPNLIHTLLAFARLEEADRNLPQAMALLDRAAALGPGNHSVMLARAIVLGRMNDMAAAVAVLDGMATDHSSLGANELLEKGRLFDRMGRTGEAFAAFTIGKQRLRENTGHSYLAEQAEHMTNRLKNFFTAQRLATLPRAAVRTDVAQPLFVLGFPRSGTTLLEQTLTAHSRVAAGDELPIISELAELMPRMLDSPLTYPEALAELWMGDHREDLDNLRDHYLRRVAQLGIVAPGKLWFTDKMPLNETNLGLIHLLFPASPLVHVIRHPLDVVLSVFSNLLTHGYFCAYALESAARHFVLMTELVEHYRREIPLRYLTIHYEDVVTDQEAVVRRVLDFVGLDFEPSCLAFHENRRYARTASYAQVSERLYDRSRYRYRKYIEQLRPVIPMLEPVIQRLGYVV